MKNRNKKLYLLECWRLNWNWPGQLSIDTGSNSVLYFTGGIQRKAGDLQWARFDGSVSKLMKQFYK